MQVILMWYSDRTWKALVQTEVSTTRRYQPLVSDDEGKFVDPSDTTPSSSIFILPCSYSHFNFFLHIRRRSAELTTQFGSAAMPCD